VSALPVYFGLWDGLGPSHAGPRSTVGWYLEQIEGLDGEGVSEATQTQILATCSRSPVMCACEPTGFEGAFREKLLSAMA
jgi:hypothetical protein